MMIVDSQVHIWGADTPERPWPRNRPVKAQRDVPLGMDELLREMDAAGVSRVVIVPPSWEGDRNDLALAAAHAHPGRFAVMGRIDPVLPESRRKIAAWRQQPGMLGLRFVFHRSPLLELLTEGKADWLWPEAEKYSVPVYMLVPHRHLHHVERIAARHPGLKLVMDHSGLVDGRDEEAFKEFDKLLALAKYPNVATKVSCFPFFTTQPYPFRNLHAYIRKAFDAFGPKRTFWGTDLSRLPCTYKQGVTLFTEELAWLKGQDLEWVTGRGVCDWLGWKIPG
jgi:predicted TIM-barrel fold metal-dependent hydrolase